MTKPSGSTLKANKPSASQLKTITAEEYQFIILLREELKKPPLTQTYPMKGAMDWFTNFQK